MKILGGVTAFVIAIIYGAWIFMLGWGWFVVPLGVPSIGLVHSAGLSTLIHVNCKYINFNEESDKSLGERILTIIVFHTLILLFFWLFSRGMNL